jgi:hypothetical protein
MGSNYGGPSIPLTSGRSDRASTHVLGMWPGRGRLPLRSAQRITISSGWIPNRSNCGRQATERRALRRRRTPNSRENLPAGACQVLTLHEYETPRQRIQLLIIC